MDGPAASEVDKWTRADSLVRRLPPETFTDLPARVVVALKERGCTIPQADWAKPELHNVIQGVFRQAGQKDWAILCSRGRRSSILIFWAGSTEEVTEIAVGEDRAVLQGSGDGTIVFSRIIGTADGDYIRTRHRAYGGPTPPPVIDHDGINDAFVGKVSVVHYYHQGVWLRLQGAD